MTLNTNKREGDKLHAEEWNELVQEVQGKQSRLNIVDALDSDSAVDVLSAKQGKMLKGMIDNATTNVNNVADVVKTLPVGYFYGTFSTEESLPTEITEKGYAYVGTENPYIIYTFDTALGWTATENKYSTPALETDLSTGSEVKAPTTKAVKEGIEAVDVTTEQEFTTTQKETARTNIGAQENITTMQDKFPVVAALNDRVADVTPITGEVKALGYKVLNPALSFAEQIEGNANTIFEIRDEFDISNIVASAENVPTAEYFTLQSATFYCIPVTVPANCAIHIPCGWMVLDSEQTIISDKPTTYFAEQTNIYIGFPRNNRNRYIIGNDPDYTYAYTTAYPTTINGEKYTVTGNINIAAGKEFRTLFGVNQIWDTNNVVLSQDSSVTFIPESDATVKLVSPIENIVLPFYRIERVVNIPQGAEFYFNGGRLKNGTLCGGDIFVSGSTNEVFNNTSFTGTSIRNDIVDAEWFKFYADGVSDDFYTLKVLNEIINSTSKITLRLGKNKVYKTSIGVLNFPSGFSYTGGADFKNNTIFSIINCSDVKIDFNGSTIQLFPNATHFYSIIFTRNSKTTIYNGTLKGDRGYHLYTDIPTGTYEFCWGIDQRGGDLYVKDFTSTCHEGDSILAGSDAGIRGSYVLENVELSYCGRQGLSAHSSSSITKIERCNFHHIGGYNPVENGEALRFYNPQCGIDFEFEDGFGADTHVRIIECNFEKCNRSGVVVSNQHNTGSIIKTFEITDSSFNDAGLLLNNLHNKSYVRNCTYVESSDEVLDRLYFSVPQTVTVENCKIITERIMLNPYFKGCEITTGISSTTSVGYDTVGATMPDTIMFEDCKLTINNIWRCHNLVFKNTEFNIRCTTFNHISCSFLGCTIKSEGNVVAGGYTVNQQGVVQRDTILDGCRIKIANTDNMENTFLSRLPNTNIIVSNCNIESTSFITISALSVKYINTQFVNCTNLSANRGTTFPLVFDGCSFYNCKTVEAGVGNITFEGCTIKCASDYANLSSAFLIGTGSFYEPKYINCVIDVPTTYTKNNAVYDSYKGTYTGCRIALNLYTFRGDVLIDSVVNYATTDAAFNPSVLQNTVTLRNNVIKNNKGDSASRPELGSKYVGFSYFDTTLGKPIYWNGTAWVDNPNVRPGENIPIGFEIYDLELKKPIYWDGYAWRDVNGSYIFDNSGSLQNRLALISPIKGQQFKLTREGETDVYLIYGDYGWLNATDRSPWFDDSGTLNAMYDKYNYTLLTEEPSDWPTAYKTYYKIVDGVYTKLTASETWALDTYYKKDENVYTGIQVKLTGDNTELYNKVVKWNGTKYINIIDNVALKAGTPEVTFTTENNTTTATITSTSSGKIYYTKDGNNPTSSSTEYSSAITLADGDQVKAICIRDHMDNSNIGYVPVAKPVITFNDGILHIECDTPDAKIYYTTDGNPPSTSSTVYDSSASVTIATGITVKAFAALIGRVNSEVTTKKRS